MGVCDGHGANGHHASEHVKTNLPLNISLLDKMAIEHSKKEDTGAIQEVDEEYEDQQVSKQHSQRTLDDNDGATTEPIRDTFLLSDDRRKKYAVISEGFVKTSIDITRKQFDVNYSGTTIVSIMLTGNRLVCANVGDSRAVLSSLRLKTEVAMLYD